MFTFKNFLDNIRESYNLKQRIKELQDSINNTSDASMREKYQKDIEVLKTKLSNEKV